MKNGFILLLFLGWVKISTAQILPQENLNHIFAFLKMVEKDNISELADHVNYPLKRPNPIPDIYSACEFKLYYNTLFDSTIKKELKEATWSTANTVVNYRGTGLLHGKIWLDEEGRLLSVNYNSKAEMRLQKQLHEEDLQRVHLSVLPWKKNELVAGCEKFIIRLDEMEDGTLRYVSWSHPKIMEDEPDLILKNGKTEVQGTARNICYTFKNYSWTYQITDTQIGESEDDLGIHLFLLKEDKEEARYKCKKLK